MNSALAKKNAAAAEVGILAVGRAIRIGCAGLM
jgi:hypothetical protein